MRINSRLKQKGIGKKKAGNSTNRLLTVRPGDDRQRKDTTSRDQHDRATKHMVQLQTTSTSSDERTRENTPKHQHGMWCFDQLKRKDNRFKDENIPGTTWRLQEKFIVFLDPTVDPKELGNVLSRAGDELKNGKRELVQCTDDPDHYHQMIYGDRKKSYTISDKVDDTLWQSRSEDKKSKKLPHPPLADSKNCKDDLKGQFV